MSSSATALFLRFSDGEDHSKFMARSTSLLVIHNTQNKEEQSFDSMCRYQFLGGFPTANLTSNPQKKASHRKFNLKIVVQKNENHNILWCAFSKISPLRFRYRNF